MALEFINPRKPTSLDELNATQQDQLKQAGKKYDGVDAEASVRLDPDGDFDEDNGSSFYGSLELWDVHEDGAHKYDAIFYMADSGVLVEKGSNELVIERIQASFGGGDGNRTDDEAFEEALQDAYRAAKQKYAAQLKAVKATGAWGAYQEALDATEKITTKKSTAKKPATKKTPAKKPAVKKPAAKKPAVKKPATKKATAKKPAKKAAKAAKKTTTKSKTKKKSPAKKPKKAPAKKPAKKK